jgi:hypothetical protein
MLFGVALLRRLKILCAWRDIQSWPRRNIAVALTSQLVTSAPATALPSPAYDMTQRGSGRCSIDLVLRQRGQLLVRGSFFSEI